MCLCEHDIKMTRAKSRWVKVVCNHCNVNMAQFKDFQKLVASIRTDFEKKFDQLISDLDTQLSALKNSFTAPLPSNNSDEIPDGRDGRSGISPITYGVAAYLSAKLWVD